MNDRGQDDVDIDADIHVKQAYHQAVQAEDERPSETTRLAILAAAARAVQARPHRLDADVIKPDSKKNTGVQWLSFRQPLAMAATVVFALGVGLTWFEQQRGVVVETSSSVRPDASMSEAGRTSATVSKPMSADAPSQVVSDMRTEPVNPSTEDSSTSKVTANVASNLQRVRGEQLSSRPSNKPSTTEAEAQSAAKAQGTVRSAPAVAPSVASAPGMATNNIGPALSAAPVPVPAVPAPPADVDARKSSTTFVREESKTDSYADLKPRLNAPASALAARAETPRSAIEWLTAIIELRRNGKHAEAERELQGFRRTYPQADIPREALP